MLVSMTKVIYARVADDVHEYLTAAAAESGLSVSRTVEALVRGARDQGWKVHLITAGPQAVTVNHES